MRVAIVLPSISGGGAELVATRWAQELQERGADVKIILTAVPTGRVLEIGVPLSYPPHDLSFLRSILRVRAELLNDVVDVVVSLMPYANLACLAAVRLLGRRRRPVLVISEHTVHPTLLRTKRLGHRVQLLLARCCYRTADAAIAVSHPVGTMMTRVQGVRPACLWVMPNPVIGVDTEPGPRLRSEQPLTTINIAIVGRLVEEKRPWLAFGVAEALRAQGHHVILHFFGEGPLESDLRNFARESAGEAEFHGWVTRWYDDLPRAAVLASFSPTEGLGNVLIEAARAGIISVACSRALGVSDASIPGITSILIAEDDCDAYASAILKARAMDLSPESIGPWLDRFTSRHAGEHLMALLQKLLNAKSASYSVGSL